MGKPRNKKTKNTVTTVARRFDLVLIALVVALAQPALGYAHEISAPREGLHATMTSATEAEDSLSAGNKGTSQFSLPACPAAPFDQQNLPLVDANDIVAQQLRITIANTPEEALRGKLRQVYFRYLGCL